jgi:hypothetical protein
MKKQEFDKLISETFYNHEINNFEELEKFNIQFNENSDNYSAEMSIQLSRPSGEIKSLIIFSIDFGSIQPFLNKKQSTVNILNPETKKNLAKLFESKFDECISKIGTFNGEKDFCEDLAVFIESNKQRIISPNFGL